MIPKIIHQVWSGSLPDFLKEWSKSWREYNPDWKYEFWDDDRMNSFIEEYFPEYVEVYNNFPYNVQRWDAIRYLFLWKMGGMYVDFDSECLEPIEGLFRGKDCCFSLEPHANPEFKDIPYLSNALMACSSEHPFMLQIIKKVFSGEPCSYPVDDKFFHVLSTTGPLVVTNTYDEYSYKDDIYLIPAELVAPFSIKEIGLIMTGIKNDLFEEKLQKARAIHYFLGTWRKNE